jgi:enamine deaminase RidA (YjgF/YER057c/UK114 family)
VALIPDRTGWCSVPDLIAEPSRSTTLPPVPAPQGAYVPAIRHGDIVVSAGMTPRRDGALVIRGRVGDSVSASSARDAAATAGENALAAVADAGGGLLNVQACLRLTVFVACADDFEGLSAIADGASDALAQHLGARGRPARSAVGVQSLPGGAPVEVELTVAVGTTI